MLNTVAVSELKEKQCFENISTSFSLILQCFSFLLYDVSILQYSFLAAYLIEHFVPPSDEENYLVLFVKKWANPFQEYGFLFEDVHNIADQIRMEDYQMT